jgi:hypothetical protein
MLSALLAVFTLLISGHNAGAQAVYGQILGSVTDPSGAAIPNAAVTVSNVSKGTEVTVQTNADGRFTADHLIPDVYDVKITAAGFKGFQQTGIQVFADTSPNVHAELAVGAADQTIQVNANDVPQLKVDRADVATELTSKEIVDLPIPDRNFTNLQLLLPGAQQLGWSHAADENPQGSKQIEVDGQAFAGVAFQLDGTDNQDPILGIIVVNPNADSLSETKITTQNFDAEFGKAVSSVVTAQTKSGSNSFHGSAFDYRESSYNKAREPFTQAKNVLTSTNPFPAAIKSQFGGALGGPIIKDRLFFFVDYQGVRQKVGTAFVQTVPSAHLISTCLGSVGCDFSEYTQALTATQPSLPPYHIYQNIGGVSTPYPNDVIPKSQLSTPALNLLKLLQPYTPNTAGTLNRLKNNYAGSGAGLFNSDQWDVRGDDTLTATTHLFTRFSRFTDTLTGNTLFGQAGGAGTGIGGYGGSSKGANDSLAIGADIAVNPKLVTDVRLGYFRWNIVTAKFDQSNATAATDLGMPGLNTGTLFTNGLPGIQVQDVGEKLNTFPGQDQGSQYGAALNINRCNCPLIQKEDQFQIVNNWTRTIGNHAVKFGADLRYARNLRVPSDNDRTGLLRFGSGPTSSPSAANPGGLGFATFVLGDVTEFLRYVSTSINAKEFQKRDFFYVQDTWRVSQKLTANLGVRYEFYFPESVNGPGNGSLLNLNTGYLQVAGVGTVGSNMNYEKPGNTWNPRVGLAYQMDQKTVIRAGYGRSFDIGVFGSIFGHAATQNLPILASQDVVSPSTASFAFLLQNGPTAPKPTPVPSNGLLPNPGNLVTSRARLNPLRLPTLDAWNAAVQRSITPTVSITIAYAGNKGTHTLGNNSDNTVNPNEAAITLPAQYSINGQTLTYDPNGPKTLTPTSTATTTSTENYLKRYYGGKLAACSDPAYATVGGINAANGGCGWTSSVTSHTTNLDSHFNALQITLTKQFSHGVSWNANYAYQHAITEAGGFSTWSRSAVKGNDGSLRRQQVIVYGLFQLPFGHGRAFLSNANSVVNQIVNGIEISPVITYSSGLPFTLGYSSCSPAQLPSSAPCYVNGSSGSFHKHITGFPGNSLQFYNAYTLTGSSSGFSIPAVDQIGTAGRNTVFGPTFFNTDLSIQKNFLIRERVTFQLRADGFNAFNHINWNNPGSNIDQPGSISSGPYPDGSANPRQLQFSARVQF